MIVSPPGKDSKWIKDLWSRSCADVLISCDKYQRFELDFRTLPRICFVKQSTQSDLYCIGPNASASDIVASTLMRSGPVALFSALNAEFRIVEPEDDPETRIWRQPAEDLGWMDIRNLERLRESTPLTGVGQSEYASRAADIDWSQYDIVISLDISVPARITKQYPCTVWCYYVREPKTSAYSASRISPLPGYQLFLNQEFHLIKTRNRRQHEICFPYYLQYTGCFDELFGSEVHSPTSKERRDRKDGLFLEQHSASSLSNDDITLLRNYWSLCTTAPTCQGKYIDKPSNLTLLQRLELLRKSKFMLRLSDGRNIWGNAIIESIASGCAVLGDPTKVIHSEFFPRRARVSTLELAVKTMLELEGRDEKLNALWSKQARLVDYACWRRPISDLLKAVAAVRKQRVSP